jgi:mTERF domain-containing protein
MSLFPPLAIYAKPHLKFPNLCTGTAVPSTTPPDRGVVTEFLVNKCSLTEEEIKKTFKHCNCFLRLKSVQNCEEVLELLNGCGLTTPAQIRKVALFNPRLFFQRSERNIKSKLSFLRIFMKEDDIVRLINNDRRFIQLSKDRLKSAVSVLQKLGIEGEALSEGLARQPRLLTASEKDVMESFKEVEDLGIKKGSKTFAYALRGILGVEKEKLDRRRLCLTGLGFSEYQISFILRRQPMILGLSEEKVKRNVDFLVNSAGLPLDDFVKYPLLFSRSLEKNIIPRFRVMEALKSMHLLNTEMSFIFLVKLTKKKFLEKYVNSNADCSSVLLDIYHGGKAGKLQGNMQKVSLGKTDPGKTDPGKL